MVRADELVPHQFTPLFVFAAMVREARFRLGLRLLPLLLFPQHGQGILVPLELARPCVVTKAEHVRFLLMHMSEMRFVYSRRHTTYVLRLHKNRRRVSSVSQFLHGHVVCLAEAPACR